MTLETGVKELAEAVGADVKALNTVTDALNLKIDLSILQPSMTGSITLNGTTDNTVVTTDIVTELGLEIGDVIRIDTGAYNKLHTVESITDNSSIIVNYEHAGNRGNGPLKLPDFTGQATVTRVAKWYNAPLGLGQDWVDVKDSRSTGVTYPNDTKRSIQLLISGAASVSFSINGLTVAQGSNGNNETNQMFAIIPDNSTYAFTSSVINHWNELR